MIYVARVFGPIKAVEITLHQISIAYGLNLHLIGFRVGEYRVVLH